MLLGVVPPRPVVVHGLPGAVLAACGLPRLPPPAEAAVEVPRVHVGEDHPETVLEKVGRLGPVAAPPRLDHVDLGVEVHGDVGPLGQRGAPQDDGLGGLVAVRPHQPVKHLRLELGPHGVVVGHVLRLHRCRDVPVLGPAVEVHLVPAEVHHVPDLGQLEQLLVQALEYTIRVLVDGIQLAAIRLPAIRRPWLLINAQCQLPVTVLRPWIN